MNDAQTPQDAAAEMAAKVREKAIAALAPLAEEMRVGEVECGVPDYHVRGCGSGGYDPVLGG